MADNGGLDPALADGAWAHAAELWVLPELERRGEAAPDEVTRAVVLLTDPPTVLLNEEAEIIIEARATRRIEAGEPITIGDISDIQQAKPANADPNRGWILRLVLGESTVTAFDFRSNRERAGEMLDLAESYLSAARGALDAGLLGPSIDSALSAAELSVKATTSLLGIPERRQHSDRLEFWDGWVEHGNAPPHVAETFRRLTDERAAARYADRPISLTPEEIAEDLRCVGDIIANAREHQGANSTFLDADHAIPLDTGNGE